MTLRNTKVGPANARLAVFSLGYPDWVPKSLRRLSALESRQIRERCGRDLSSLPTDTERLALFNRTHVRQAT